MSSADLDPSVASDHSHVVFAAMSNNDLDLLQRLVETAPRSTRNSLLHLAVTLDKYEMFTFLLSLDYFDRQAINAAFKLCLMWYDAESVFRQERYVLDLMETGADDFFFVDRDQNTALHIALKRHFNRVARILIERGMGLDVRNRNGCTPFHMIFHMGNDLEGVEEAVGLMLYYGADCLICDHDGYLPFDLSVMYDPDLTHTQEVLFYSTFDQHSSFKMSPEVLFELLQSPSTLFLQVVDYVSEIIFPQVTTYISWTLFLKIKPEYLRIMIDKFDYVISRFFLNIYPVFWDDIQHTIPFRNWEMLLNSHLALDTIEFIGRIRIEFVVEKLSEDQIDPKIIQDFVYYLLSYGINVWKKDLDMVYKHYGYCQLFKTLLHMEIRKSNCDIVPRLIYDVHLDLDTIFDYPLSFSMKALEELLNYSARPKLKALCYQLNSETFIRRARNLPSLPSLVELARDGARRFLVQRFNVDSSRQFYWLLNRLPISAYHKKIISFERQLYTE